MSLWDLSGGCLLASAYQWWWTCQSRRVRWQRRWYESFLYCIGRRCVSDGHLDEQRYDFDVNVTRAGWIDFCLPHGDGLTKRFGRILVVLWKRLEEIRRMLRYHGQVRRGAVKCQLRWSKRYGGGGESLTERQRRGKKWLQLCALALKAAGKSKSR